MNSVLETFGDLEDAPGDNMVVRLLGYDVGTSAGWFHFNGGWCVMVPEYAPNESLQIVFGVPYLEHHRNAGRFGLIVDFYSAQLALVEHPPQGEVGQVQLLWNGPLKVIK